MTIGEEVLIHGYIDEIRKDIVIIRNEGGYFGTVPEEIRSSSEIPNTCGDAISRQAVLDIIAFEDKWLFDANGHNANTHIAFSGLESRVKALPSVSPQQRTGRWEWVQYDYNPKLGNWHCSECRSVVMECVDKNEKSYIPLYKYCPQCGCKMEVEE